MDVYKIIIKESSLDDPDQKLAAINTVSDILGLRIMSAKDIVDNSRKIACTAIQAQVLHEKLKPLGYDVNILQTERL